MASLKLRRVLAAQIVANLPSGLSSSQAKWWSQNPDCLANYLNGLAQLVVVEEEPNPKQKDRNGKQEKRLGG